MRVALPDNPFFDPLCAAAERYAQEHTTRILRLPEVECTKLLLNNMVDIALLSPLGYGSGVLHADFRIIPTTACMLRGWTNTGRIVFAQHLGEVHSIASAHPDDYLMHCAALLLEEQYDISVPVTSFSGSWQEAIEQSECVLGWSKDLGDARGLDIAEEWDVAYSMPLPMAMWVCRSEYVLDAGTEQDAVLERLSAFCRDIAQHDLADAEQCREDEAVADTECREGCIEWKWSDALEQSLEPTLQLLYQRQLLPEIPAIKILGRD